MYCILDQLKIQKSLKIESGDSNGTGIRLEIIRPVGTQCHTIFNNFGNLGWSRIL